MFPLTEEISICISLCTQIVHVQKTLHMVLVLLLLVYISKGTSILGCLTWPYICCVSCSVHCNSNNIHVPPQNTGRGYMYYIYCLHWHFPFETHPKCYMCRHALYIAYFLHVQLALCVNSVYYILIRYGSVCILFAWEGS